MTKAQETILGWVVFVGLISHFGLGYFFWDVIKVVNIYYVSIYFMVDVMGFVIYLTSRESKMLKGMGALGMVLGTFYLYREFNNPMYWTERNFITLGLVLSNTFFIWYFTDKIKNKAQ
ncbi:MAG: hypothetical protein V4538_15315 [Bacteroidota bacterium]